MQRNELRSMRVTPHVAQNTSGRRSATDGRTTRHRGYGVSLRIRKRIEEAFGRIKTIARQDKTRFRGRDRVGWGIHVRSRCLQSGAASQVAGRHDMNAPANCTLIDHWRIVEADIWDRDYLELGGPATITIGASNYGEIAFGAMRRACLIAQGRFHRGHICLSHRRRGNSQSQTRDFSNSLIGLN